MGVSKKLDAKARLLDLGQVVGDLVVELVPVRAGIGRAVQIDQRPVGIGRQAVEGRDVALERRDSLRIELNNQRLINRTTTEKR